MKYLLVTGSRHWDKSLEIAEKIENFAANHGYDNVFIVTGDCKSGADKTATTWARLNEVPYLSWPARWSMISRKAAGPIRNKKMVAWLRTIEATGMGEVYVMGFPRGESKGTRGCLKECLENFDFVNIEVFEYDQV